MSSNKKESIFRKVLTRAILTATGVIVAAYTTNLVNQRQYDNEKNRRAEQLFEALNDTSQRFNEYERLLEEYRPAPVTRSLEPISISGQWFTPDGTVSWSFYENSVTVSGVGEFIGVTSGAGTFDVTQDTVTGQIRLSTVFWLPTNETISFRASINREGNIMTGQIVDTFGQVAPLALYKQW